MKKFRIWVLLVVSIPAFSQVTPLADKKFLISINNKLFQSSDTIEKEDLNTITSSSLDVINSRTNGKFHVISYRWVISMKDSNNIYKGDYSSVDNKRIVCNKCCKALTFHELVEKMKPNDLIWLDELVLNETKAAFPKQFVFYLR